METPCNLFTEHAGLSCICSRVEIILAVLSAGRFFKSFIACGDRIISYGISGERTFVFFLPSLSAIPHLFRRYSQCTSILVVNADRERSCGRDNHRVRMVKGILEVFFPSSSINSLFSELILHAEQMTACRNVHVIYMSSSMRLSPVFIQA